VFGASGGASRPHECECCDIRVNQGLFRVTACSGQQVSLMGDCSVSGSKVVCVFVCVVEDGSVDSSALQNLILHMV